MTGALLVMAAERTRQERLGDAIRAARKAKGPEWTQTELAERIGSSQSYISLLESGEVGQPGDKLLARIALALGLDLNDLLVDSGWPDMSAYLAELHEAQEALAGFSGKRIEIIEMLSDMPEDDADKVWSYTSYLREEQERYDEGATEVLEEDWRELFRLVPKLPPEAARTFVGMARLMIPQPEPEDRHTRTIETDDDEEAASA